MNIASRHHASKSKFAWYSISNALQSRQMWGTNHIQVNPILPIIFATFQSRMSHWTIHILHENNLRWGPNTIMIDLEVKKRGCVRKNVIKSHVKIVSRIFLEYSGSDSPRHENYQKDTLWLRLASLIKYIYFLSPLAGDQRMSEWTIKAWLQSPSCFVTSSFFYFRESFEASNR